MGDPVIVGMARTSFGSFLGSLSSISAVSLGTAAVKSSLQKAGVSSEEVDNVFLGMVVQAGCGQIPSRQVTLAAGFPEHVPSDTINKVCASGLRAVNLAGMLIRAGEAEVVVAGGMENMSQAPYLLARGRTGYRMGHDLSVDAMIKDGLWCPFHQVHMGVHGSKVPMNYGITRKDADQWALRSHQRAVKAMDQGLFEKDIVPVEVKTRKKTQIIDTDEIPRRDTSLEKLEGLPPAFEKDGIITAGNAPAISDGAAAVVVMSREKARQQQKEILAEIVSSGSISQEPSRIATVPEAAARIAMEKSKLKPEDLDLIEVNEAFATVPLTCMKTGGWEEEKINVNGGAVALGHPIGASGGRILISLISELRRRGGGKGLATICSGAAQGEAAVIMV